MNWTSIAIVVILFSWPCQALRCRTEDGPGEEELKKIARICMKKVGENDSNEDSRGSNEDNDEDNYGMSNSNRNNQQNGNRNYYDNNNNNYNGQSGNYPGENRGNSFGQPQQSSRDPNGYQNWNNQNSNGNNYDWNRNQSYGGGSGGRGNGRRNNNNSNNQTEHDRACFVHCFFHELKLTSSDDQPDKFKMLTVLTRSIRDVELKQFLIDSIQECFHMIEHTDNYRRRSDKCDSAQAIANCLTERSRTNCDDFNDGATFL